ncbi:MAG TPA: YkgJ family cysteine cluster protein [Blastocatellia bacterium]|jgi:Fe-S-cluster containining protein|nr:YkgJ family cysteine cluster protein [Blastocatellia bacterium]
MHPDDIFSAYEQHVSAVDAEFRRVYQKFDERMQCRRGCSMCCSQMFSISRIEAAYISRAIKAMPEGERDRLRTGARQYVADARKLIGKDEESDEEEAITPRPGLRLACPALVGDACSIYEARPIICRKWGIPIFNPAKPAELQACELNFKPGEEVEIEGLIEPQVALLEEWVELKGLAKRSLGLPQTRSTVAEAILDDFDEPPARPRPGSNGNSRSGD